MQMSPKAAIPKVIAKETHHQRGVGFSTAPAMRLVTQSKLRLFRTSGTRASGGVTEVEASPAITSGAVVDAPSIREFLPLCVPARPARRQAVFVALSPDRT